MEKQSFHQSVINVQRSLKAPKSQYNNFGKYRYRSCEDILEALKPLLAENGLYLTITDNVEQVGDRIYLRATATLTDGERHLSAQGFAREEETKKGQDASQTTGSASSYARKYALNGLFCIDDTKDADATNNGQEQEKPKATSATSAVANIQLNAIMATISKAKTKKELAEIYDTNKSLHGNDVFMSALSARKNQIL